MSRAITEIGTYTGGTALWLADNANAMALEPKTISIDRRRLHDLRDPRIDFRTGDFRNLSAALSEAELAALPRPILVIEDGSHFYEDSLAMLRYFRRWLRCGEYYVASAGTVEAFNASQRYNGGPLRAIREFLDEAAGEFEIDRNYCDFFGRNVTWNAEGFLRRL